MAPVDHPIAAPQNLCSQAQAVAAIASPANTPTQ